MTPSATEWRGMEEAMTFPALVQFNGGVCAIYQTSFLINHELAIRWQPFIEPAPPLPKPDAFAKWLRSLPNNILASELTDRGRREGWDAGEAHGRSEERARFSAGVERCCKKWDAEAGYMSPALFADLRALAKGAAS